MSGLMAAGQAGGDRVFRRSVCDRTPGHKRRRGGQRRLYQELDGKVDAFGFGGYDLGLTVNGRYYPFYSVRGLVEGLQTPVVDGGSVRALIERRTAKALYAEIRCAGYDGGYTRVTDFIRAWRQSEGQGAAANAFIPLAFELGEAYQFDWSEEGLVVGGIYYRAQVAHMKLCASRAFWLVAYPCLLYTSDAADE